MLTLEQNDYSQTEHYKVDIVLEIKGFSTVIAYLAWSVGS